MAPKSSKVVITIDSDSPTEVTVKVGSKTTSSAVIEETGSSGSASNLQMNCKGKSKGKAESSATSSYPHAGSSKDKKADLFTTRGVANESGEMSTAESDDWDKIPMVIHSDDVEPHQPDYPPPGWPSPRPPTESPPSPHSPDHPPPRYDPSPDEAASDPSTSPAELVLQAGDPNREIQPGEVLCLTRKSGRVFHKRSCGILKRRRDDELHLPVGFCGTCAVGVPVNPAQRFMFNQNAQPKLMHYVWPDGSARCRLSDGAGILLTGCRQCIWR